MAGNPGSPTGAQCLGRAPLPHGADTLHAQSERRSSLSRLEAVTFDFWNTLMWEGPDALVGSRLGALGAVLEETGAVVDERNLRDAHAVAFARYQAAWHANQQFCVPDAVGVLVRELGLDEGDLRLQRMLCEAFDIAGDRAELHLSDGAEACLRALHDHGVKLSIVCDIGLTPSPVLRRRLDDLGLLDLFTGWAFSDEVGCYKPDPRIFEHALEGLGGVDPRRAAHVGDRLRTDCGGAKQIGMLAVRYRAIYDDPAGDGPEGDLIVDDLRALPVALDLL